MAYPNGSQESTDPLQSNTKDGIVDFASGKSSGELPAFGESTARLTGCGVGAACVESSARRKKAAGRKAVLRLPEGNFVAPHSFFMFFLRTAAAGMKCGFLEVP